MADEQQQANQAPESQPTQQQPAAPPQQAPASAQQQNAQQTVPTAPQPPKNTKQPLGAGATVFIILISAVLGAGVLFGLLDITGMLCRTVYVDSSDGSSAGQTITINASTEDATVSEAVAAKALPSVCSIHVASSSEEGVGSGVVLDTDGNILTNYHVIEGADTISVTLNNVSYDAEVVGYDADTDLAVINIDADASDLTPIEVGDSDSLVVGDWVMTIGSPYGLDQSVSAGVVSSLYRSTMLSSTTGSTIYANLIQTDAAINPGNSGGALVNDQGQLVGINTLNASYTGSSSGVGFAIPGNYAMSVAKTIIAGDEVEHPYIGVSVQTVNSRNAKANDLDVTQGAYVAEVGEGSPAAEAGLEVGDIITKVDSEAVSSADALILAIRGHEIGDSVTLTVVRDGKEQEIEVTLDGRTDAEAGEASDISSDDRDIFGSGRDEQMPGQNSYAEGTIEIDATSYEVEATRQASSSSTTLAA